MNLWNSSRPARLVQKDLCDILDTRKPYCEIDSAIFYCLESWAFLNSLRSCRQSFRLKDK